MGRRGEGWRDCRVLSKRRKEGDGENKIRREGNQRERIISCGLPGKARVGGRGGEVGRSRKKKKKWSGGEEREAKGRTGESDRMKVMRGRDL